MRNKEGTLMPETVILRKNEKGEHVSRIDDLEICFYPDDGCHVIVGEAGKNPCPDVKLTNFSARRKKSAIQETALYPKIVLICLRMSFIKDLRYFAMKAIEHSYRQGYAPCS